MSQPTLSERVGIAGSGAIACGLASLAAPLGEVTLWARSERSGERARELAGDGPRLVRDLEGLRDSTVVVESVVEDEATKAEVLGALGELLPPDSLVATTTSALSVERLAEASGRPDRFAALHLFNPVQKMPLVELAFPPAASDETRRRARDLCEALGKTPVEVPDTPGFVVNRLLFPYLFEAVRMVERDGLDPESVDTCMKLGASHPMGPLALLDFVGLDVAAAIGESIGAEVPRRVRELIDAGRLGKKSGAGFYDY